MVLTRHSPLSSGALKAIAGFALAGLMGAAAYFYPVLATTVSSESPGDSLSVVTNPLSTGPFTVLLLGSDDDSKFPGDQVNTQSMILVRVDPGTNQVTMLSIPRDLWVPIPGQPDGKISTAFRFGGAHEAMQTVSNNFHVRIDDFVWIGLKGLVDLIDRIGGIDIIATNPVTDDFYPADLNSTSPYDYSRIAILPGAVHLDGAQALEYVRARHGDLRGDFGRSARQQQVLVAIKAKAKQLNATDLPGLATALNGEIKTSIAFTRIKQLLGLANEFGGDGIHQQLLMPPYTADAVVDGQDVLLPNWDLILPVVAKSFPE